MDAPVQYYDEKSYIKTQTGHLINRNAQLCGTPRIVIRPHSIIRENVVIRGDLCDIALGRYCILMPGAILRPPLKRYASGPAYVQQSIGDFVYVGDGSCVSALNIGSYVYIGKNCVIGDNCTIRNCAVIMDDTVLAPGTCVPPFAVVEGNPGVFVDHLPDVSEDLMEEFSKSCYNNYLPNPVSTPKRS